MKNFKLKKQISLLCAFSGLIIAIICQVMQRDLLLFINQMIPIVAIFALIPLSKKEIHFNILVMFSVWITIYNIFYVVFRILNIADLYSVSFRVIIQLFIPSIVALFMKRWSDFREEI